MLQGELIKTRKDICRFYQLYVAGFVPTECIKDFPLLLSTVDFLQLYF